MQHITLQRHDDYSFIINSLSAIARVVTRLVSSECTLLCRKSRISLKECTCVKPSHALFSPAEPLRGGSQRDPAEGYY